MADRIYCGDLKRVRALAFQFQEILRAYERQKGFCMECGAGPLEKFTTHHVKPRRIGGGDEAENLEIVCSGTACHHKREARSCRVYGLRHNR